jgi:hypothetical protein
MLPSVLHRGHVSEARATAHRRRGGTVVLVLAAAMAARKFPRSVVRRALKAHQPTMRVGSKADVVVRTQREAQTDRHAHTAVCVCSYRRGLAVVLELYAFPAVAGRRQHAPGAAGARARHSPAPRRRRRPGTRGPFRVQPRCVCACPTHTQTDRGRGRQRTHTRTHIPPPSLALPLSVCGRVLN